MVRSMVVASVELVSGVFVVMVVEYEVVGSPVVSGRSYLEVGFHYVFIFEAYPVVVVGFPW